MFYQVATAKARLRVASVRIKRGVSHETGRAIVALVHEYERNMRADVEIDPNDNRRLEFWHADDADPEAPDLMYAINALMTLPPSKLH